MKEVFAVACSDIHLCHTCPPARAAEPDWYEAMARPLVQLSQLVADYNVPVICAGDVFDRWNSPPELINFAMNMLPKGMYAIPGQHDLPYHEYEQIRKSAYWTLCESECIVNMIPEAAGGLRCGYAVDDDATGWMFPAPWGFQIPVMELEDKQAPPVNILVAHKFVWTSARNGYAGAPEDQRIDNLRGLDGYDIAIFGDNHLAFTVKSSGCQVVNTGCLIPRKQNERAYQPSVFLLMEDGTVERHKLDCSEDKWVDPEPGQDVERPAGMDEFIEELRGLGADSLDYREAVRQYCEQNKVEQAVLELILESMGEHE